VATVDYERVAGIPATFACNAAAPNVTPLMASKMRDSLPGN
jgi:hypothetical protein